MNQHVITRRSCVNERVRVNQMEKTTSRSSSITDLDGDSLAHCASYLSLQDLSNMAMSSRSLRRLAYSDSIWQRVFRDHWPQEVSSISPQTGIREAYLARRTAMLQFKYLDPFVADFFTDSRPCDHILLENNDIIFSQGSFVHMVNIDRFLGGNSSFVTLSDHKARITGMRLFPLKETSLFRGEAQQMENVLVTSSCDHSIRLWWKGLCQRCFRGHNGPVTALSDKLLGEDSDKVLGSGGEDGTVRLWSLGSSGKRGRHALKATLYGHEKPVKLMSVARHKTSLLVTISKDSKVRVWDTSTSSAVRSSCCVGMTSVTGVPVDMKCHESLLYVAAGSSVVTVDLRTMQKVVTAAVYQPKLCSFAIMPSKSLICTGGNSKAMLWDIRKNQDKLKPEQVAELDGHTGPVTLLHMDSNKIVTGGPDDVCTNVWEADTGRLTNSLLCFFLGEASVGGGCTSMAVSGSRIVTASSSIAEENGLLRYRDFSNASCPVLSSEDEHDSKFWNPRSYSDPDSSDY
ncbi:E3 ubiquitin ligase complex SCF subunit sconB [Tripterygium wilfordii]|uniref:E3 ubiquitin ligase complex SCF subunit sconB n=1 Tax=Tripterygium wilfordii TaxID=458696 RepID=A0A7J7DRN3_TRIWF|nr:uncharacterized protein LOC119996032 [Tripterygium wilfordii]KAF5749015.1 E3 ubiquitin ligase complex SCF subunit sconB [Tripterygium wilfordii]